MKTTPLAAFGYVAVLVEVDAGETREMLLDKEGRARSGQYFYIKGAGESTVKGTGETLATRTAGWLKSEHPDGNANSVEGIVFNTFPENSAWLCISHEYNPKGLPHLRSLVLQDGESVILPNNTNLLLARGTLVTPKKTFESIAQIRIRNGDVTAVSSGMSYSLYFDK